MVADCAMDAPAESNSKLQTLASRQKDELRQSVLGRGEEEKGRGVAEGERLRRQGEGANQCLGHVVVASARGGEGRSRDDLKLCCGLLADEALARSAPGPWR